MKIMNTPAPVQSAMIALALAIPASLASAQFSTYIDWTGNATDSNWSSRSNWLGSGPNGGTDVVHLANSRIRFTGNFLAVPSTYNANVTYDLIDPRFGSLEINSPTTTFASQDHNVTITGLPGTNLSTGFSDFGTVINYNNTRSQGFEINLTFVDMNLETSFDIDSNGAADRTSITLNNTNLATFARSISMPGILRVIQESEIFDNSDNGWSLDVTGDGQLIVSDLSSIDIPVNNENYTKIEDTAFFNDAFNSPGDVEIASGFMILNTLEGESVSSVISGLISGPGAFVTRGGNNVRFIGSNSFTGDIWLEGGSLEAESGPALGPLGRTMIFDNGGIFRPRGTFNALMDMQFNGAGTIDTSLTQDTHLLREPWVGKGDFTKTGTGTLEMRLDATAYNGDFFVNQGTLQITDSRAFNDQSEITINQPAILDLNTPAISIGQLKGDGTITQSSSAGGAGAGSSPLLGEPDSITLRGQGTLPLPDFSGQIIASPIIIKETTLAQIFSGDLSAFTGSWQVNGVNLILSGPLTWNGNTNIASGGVLIAEGGGAFNDELTGTGRVLKRGDNTLVFEPSNTNFPGRIDILEGTLEFNADTQGGVRVDSQGLLTGTQGSCGVIEVLSRGTFSPAGPDAATVFTVNIIFFEDRSVLEIDIIDAASNDHIIALETIINGDLQINLGAGFIPAPEDSYSIITSTTTLTGTFANLDKNNRLMTAGEEGSFVVNVDPVAGRVTLDQFMEGSMGMCSPADLTADGVLDFFDISAFLTLFGQQDPIADFNNDTQLDFFDVSAFLTLFGNACP